MSTMKKKNYCDFFMYKQNALLTSGGLWELFIKSI